jgi:hypothetical protein
LLAATHIECRGGLDLSSPTRPTSRHDCNRGAMAGFAAANC